MDYVGLGLFSNDLKVGRKCARHDGGASPTKKRDQDRTYGSQCPRLRPNGLSRQGKGLMQTNAMGDAYSAGASVGGRLPCPVIHPASRPIRSPAPATMT